MTILLLNGSPRRTGNTHLLLQEFQQHLEAAQHRVSMVDVYALKLSPCLACDSCKKNGGHCVCPDDSDRIIQEIARADAIIFGTPVYWWGVSAQLKMVIDKLYAQCDSFMSMSKKIGVITTGANPLDNPQYRIIHDQFSCIADYLHWQLAFYLAFSAEGAGDIRQQQERHANIRKALEQL